jgi:hypothetical protein
MAMVTTTAVIRTMVRAHRQARARVHGGTTAITVRLRAQVRRHVHGGTTATHAREQEQPTILVTRTITAMGNIQRKHTGPFRPPSNVIVHHVQETNQAAAMVMAGAVSIHNIRHTNQVLNRPLFPFRNQATARLHLHKLIT